MSHKGVKEKKSNSVSFVERLLNQNIPLLQNHLSSLLGDTLGFNDFVVEFGSNLKSLQNPAFPEERKEKFFTELVFEFTDNSNSQATWMNFQRVDTSVEYFVKTLEKLGFILPTAKESREVLPFCANSEKTQFYVFVDGKLLNYTLSDSMNPILFANRTGLTVDDLWDRFSPSSERRPAFSDLIIKLNLECSRTTRTVIADRAEGMWIDDENNLILNTGDKILLNGQPTDPLVGKNFYITTKAFNKEVMDMYTPSYLQDYVKCVRNILTPLAPTPNMEEAYRAELFTGAILSHFIGGAMPFRPNVQLYGESSSGKSTLIRTALNPFYSVLNRSKASTTDITVAAINNDNTSLPFILDEFELDEAQEGMIQAIRTNFSGGMKTKMEGKNVVGQENKHGFVLSAISPNLAPADRNRIFLFQIPSDRKYQDEFYSYTVPTLEAVHFNAIIYELFRRTSKILEIYKEYRSRFYASKVIASNSTRYCDSLSVIFSIMHIMLDKPMTYMDEVIALSKKMIEEEVDFKEDNETSSQKLFAKILNSEIAIDNKKYIIAHAIDMAMNDTILKEKLHYQGIRCDFKNGVIGLSSRSSRIREIASQIRLPDFGKILKGHEKYLETKQDQTAVGIKVGRPHEVRLTYEFGEMPNPETPVPVANFSKTPVTQSSQLIEVVNAG